MTLLVEYLSCNPSYSAITFLYLFLQAFSLWHLVRMLIGKMEIYLEDVLDAKQSDLRNVRMNRLHFYGYGAIRCYPSLLRPCLSVASFPIRNGRLLPTRKLDQSCLFVPSYRGNASLRTTASEVTDTKTFPVPCQWPLAAASFHRSI